MSYKNPKFIMEKTPNYVNGVAVCLSCGTELTMHKRIGGYCRDCYFRIWGGNVIRSYPVVLNVLTILGSCGMTQIANALNLIVGSMGDRKNYDL